LQEDGTRLFEKICSMDLEGVVAKPAASRHHVFPKGPGWVKIKNPAYS
jgi:ATP-dependent DNA ligase